MAQQPYIQVTLPYRYAVIVKQLEQLPHDILPWVEQLLSHLLRSPNRLATMSPTVTVPAGTLLDLAGLISTDGVGDALVDTESLYDEV